MNSIHEPSSGTMSKNRLRNNTESIRIENRPSAPSAQPKASPQHARQRAQRPGLPLACSARALASASVCTPARLPPSAPQRPRLRACAPAQLPSLSVAIQFCIAIQFCLLHPFPATIQNIVLQYNFMQPSHLQYKSCNTILVYTSLNHNTKYCIAIQTSLNSLSLCNTKTVLQ